MSKQFFRFLRGELNGYYLTNINATFNKISSNIRNFMSYFADMQFKGQDEVDIEGNAINADMLQGLSTFTGAIPPYVWQDALTGSIRFTPSHIVDDIEYSERGLYSPTDEVFNFVRTNQQEYQSDINTLANAEARSTVVETGRNPVGYFPEGEYIIQEDGSVDETKLISSPRTGHADSPYYGESFLYLAEESPVRAITSNTVLIYLIRAMQWIRYNGASIESLCKFAEIICPKFLLIISIDWDSNYAFGTVSYGIDENMEAEDKLMREQLFALLASKKLPQFTFNKVLIEVTRNPDGTVQSVTQL